MSNDLDLPHLIRVCEAATPGEWQAFIMANGNGGDATPEFIAEYVRATILKSAGESGTTEFMFVSCEKRDGPADICHVGNGPTSKENARFIAECNPTVVLAILHRLQAAEKRVGELNHDREWSQQHHAGLCPFRGEFMRDVVKFFALEMESRLEENRHKSGWDCMTDADLVQRLHDEFAELTIAMMGENGNRNGEDIVREASDIGNFLAFLSWKYRAK